MDSCLRIKRFFLNHKNVICVDDEEEDIIATLSQQNKRNLLIKGLEYRRDKGLPLKLKTCVNYGVLCTLGFMEFKIWPYKCKYTERVDGKAKDCSGRIHVYESESGQIIGYLIVNADHSENCKPEIFTAKINKRNFNKQTIELAAKTNYQYNTEIDDFIYQHNPDDFKKEKKRIKKLVTRREMSQIQIWVNDDDSKKDVQPITNELTQGNGSNGTTSIEHNENKMDFTDSQSNTQTEKFIVGTNENSNLNLLDYKKKMVSDHLNTKIAMEDAPTVQQLYKKQTFQKNYSSSFALDNNGSKYLSYDELIEVCCKITPDQLKLWLLNDEIGDIQNEFNSLTEIDSAGFNQMGYSQENETGFKQTGYSQENDTGFDQMDYSQDSQTGLNQMALNQMDYSFLDKTFDNNEFEKNALYSKDEICQFFSQLLGETDETDILLNTRNIYDNCQVYGSSAADIKRASLVFDENSQRNDLTLV